jgi:RNA polymerase sigma factor (sigma-70 family)
MTISVTRQKCDRRGKFDIKTADDWSDALRRTRSHIPDERQSPRLRELSSPCHHDHGGKDMAELQPAIFMVDLTIHRNSLYYFILKRVRDPWISEDLAQETVTRLLQYSRNQQVDDSQALGFQIATNLVRDHFRALKRDGIQPLSEDLVCETPAQEQVSIDRQRVAAFSRALASMPPLRRDVFVRRRLHDQSYAEISAALQLSHAAVEKHVVRALQWLHQEMSSYESRRDLQQPIGVEGTHE